MIAVIYNGDIRFNQDIAKENHQRLIDRLTEFGKVTTYNFTKNDPDRPVCPYDEGGEDNAAQGTYRRAAGGAVQVWDFVQSVERTVEPIVIRMRTDTWFTDDSIEIIVKELQDIIDKKSGIYFFGSDLINDNAGQKYKKTYLSYIDENTVIPNTVQDFIIIGRRECIVSLEKINARLSQLSGNKLRSGNKLFRWAVVQNSVAATVICNIFLIRKHFDLYPTDLEVYWEYVNSYVSAGKPEHMKPALAYYEKWKDSTLMISHCPICGGDTESYKIFNKIPQSSAQLFSDSKLEVKYSSFTAGICRSCFHIVNTTHVADAVENIYIDANYITKKSISAAMSNNLKDIVNFIEANLNLASNELLEIGSGSGEIANYFQNQMVVTTVDPCVDSYNNPNITHYSEFFNKDVVSKINKKFDIIIARHIIEHVADPVEFLKLCQSVLTDDGVIYIEVPNLDDILSIERLTDFFNDHIQYFSNSSLSKAGSIANLTSVNSRLFLNNAHLGMVFKNSNFDILIRLDCAKSKVSNILQDIDSIDNFIIYGAGAHAVTFASLLSTEQKNKILLVVDKDGNKSGKFLPGTQVPISTPTNFSAPLIVNTSVLYAAEVEKYLLEEQQFIGKILHL